MKVSDSLKEITSSKLNFPQPSVRIARSSTAWEFPSALGCRGLLRMSCIWRRPARSPQLILIPSHLCTQLTWMWARRPTKRPTTICSVALTNKPSEGRNVVLWPLTKFQILSLRGWATVHSRQQTPWGKLRRGWSMKAKLNFGTMLGACWRLRALLGSLWYRLAQWVKLNCGVAVVVEVPMDFGKWLGAGNSKCTV